MWFNFEKLEVYQEAIEFANRIYEMTKSFPKDEMLGVTNQIRRAAISISSNIAGLVKSRKELLSVIPAEAGIQYVQVVMGDLDPGFHRGDDFLRIHQYC